MNVTALPPEQPELTSNRGVPDDPRMGNLSALGSDEPFSVAIPDDETVDLGGSATPTAADTLVQTAGETGVLPPSHEAEPAAPLPKRRADLVIRPSNDDGSHVVKDPATAQFFDLGPEESFLLLALDGAQTAASLASAFETRFGSALSPADINEFVALARSNGFIAEPAAADPAAPPAKQRQSILYWRTTLFDPDRLFTWLEPKLRFVWTRTFLLLSAAAIVFAVGLVWSSRAALVSQMGDALRWDVLVAAWITLITVTALHECAHGLTCKHYGGEVHEVGFLLMFFTPCFFANVSDAWLFNSRSKRLWVTLAGGYCDLLLWAAAVFAWRVLQPGMLPNHIAWVVLTICGGRILFNFNPLMKLDGYYLLGDALGLANLQGRGMAAVFGRARWLLWGAPRPEAEDGGGWIFAYGLTAYLYRVVFLSAMFVTLARYARGRWGFVGLAAVAWLAWLIGRNFVAGLFAGEVRLMIAARPKRLAVWLLILGGTAAAACLVQMDREAAGPFVARTVTRSEVFSPVSGFLREVPFEQGDRATAGAMVARLEVPDLNSRLVQRRNETLELTVRLRLRRSQLEAAKDDLVRAEGLAKSAAGSQDDFRLAQRRTQASEADLEQTEARLESAKEDVKCLEKLAEKSTVFSPVQGVIMTPRLRERVGQFFHEGDLICLIEDPALLRAEINLPEQEVERVRVGQRVEIKARAIPFETFVGTVQRIAPGAAPDVGSNAVAGQNTVMVYAQFDCTNEDLRPGMTGHARVLCGKAPAGRVLAEKFLRFVRTEFWW